MNLPFVLASASPRRQALLAQIAVLPDRVLAPDVDETPLPREIPRLHALRLALAKAEIIALREPGALVLAADTVVACGRRILPKAETEEDVAACLRLLSGRRHQVMTALALCAPGTAPRTRIALTRVSFKALSAREIASYAASGEGLGKAGGYAIQGRADAFVRALNGSYSNVVGLPLFETRGLLEGAGYPGP